MIKKRFFTNLLLGVLLGAMVLAGCGEKNTVSSATETLTESSEANESKDALEQENSGKGETAEDPSGEGETAKDTSGKEENSSDKGKEEESKEVLPEATKEPFVADRSAAFELLSHINVGWNLGNTLDAHGAGNTLRSETYWGNPETTQEMFEAIAKQGFNAVRIPITYAEHVDIYNDYAINEDWMNRIQEIVDYAMNTGLYVIIDTHHEPDFWLKPDSDHAERAVKELEAIWRQVAERFKDYDEKLIFEGMNEPRMKGTPNEWNGGTPDERKVIDRLNQTFVDVVRSTGSKNENRLLVICTYGNNPSYTVIKELKIPEDNNIAVAVHMYTPFYFTYDDKTNGYSNWDGSQKNSIVSTLKQIDKYLLQKDVPVLVTEFGAVDKGNTEDIVNWIGDYMSSMNKYNIKCFWWDNNLYNSTGENFGIFNRSNLTWYNQKVADAIIANAVCE